MGPGVLLLGVRNCELGVFVGVAADLFTLGVGGGGPVEVAAWSIGTGLIWPGSSSTAETGLSLSLIHI